MDDPRRWLEERRLWCGIRTYDDSTKEWLGKSGHYLDAPPHGALLVMSLQPLVDGLFGTVAGPGLLGLAVLGRPVARMLPQDGTWAELTRFVLEKDLPRETASHMLRVTAERWFARPTAEVLISYHDRSIHSGCIYRKAGFRKDGVTRRDGRRGSWATRTGREQAVSSEVTNKRRWRLDAADVRAAVAARACGSG